MFVNQYYLQNNEKIRFERQQASDFAKEVCDDFNPIHDIDAKRFCVPGDLLFATILSKNGLSQHMTFHFKGMVTENVEISIPPQCDVTTSIIDDKGKEYLSYEAQGSHTQCESLIDSLIRSYVEFSGHTFPHILGELMEKNQVMINPARPMAMYERMEIHLDRVDFTEVSLQFNQQETALTVDGKRGQAKLVFDFINDGEIVGHGIKYMLLGGLKPYCVDEMKVLTDKFFALKDKHLASKANF